MTAVGSTARVPHAQARGIRGRGVRAEANQAYAMVLPAVTGLLALYVWPVAGTLYRSFTRTGPFGGSEWIGLGNYRELTGEDALGDALVNSLTYTVLLLLSVPLAAVLASLLNQVSRGRAVYRVLYFLPVVTLPVAVGVVWRFLYNGDFGLLNHLLGLVGVEPRYWVSDPRYALYALAAVGIWASLGTNVVILAAGLQSVPSDLYEAADLDGAGRIRQFWYLTLPLLTPSIFFVTILTVISALQMFDLLFVMLGRTNPALPGTQTIVYLFYEKAFIEYEQGYAAAIAVLLLALIVVVTAAQFRLQRRWVFYD